MVTITLPPELEQAVAEQARCSLTTVELLALDVLQERFLMDAPPAPPEPGKTMADFLDGYVGGLHSSEFVPGSAQLSQNTGQKFKDLLLKKRANGQE